MTIAMTDFARRRLFPDEGRRTGIRDCTAEQFVQHLNMHEPLKVLAGYAPFCTLPVHENWTSTRATAAAITPDNRHRLHSAYEARSADELAVLNRWFEGVEPPVARYLLPILYSREQIEKEGHRVDADWGIVGCLYTMVPEEIPMAPITMLRNALGVAEGGSGVPIDRAAYARSVAFWNTHANWR
jgi:hypothetical protein